jgi:AraC-like DNA-binding protein
MLTVYSSENLTGDRRKGWQSIVGEIYAHLDIEIAPRADFFGRIRRTSMGDIELTEVETDGECARRTARHIAHDRRDSYLYLLVRRGDLTITQFNRDCALRAGEFTLLHLNSPYLFRHDRRVSKIGLKLPGFMLRSRPAQLAAHCAVPRRADDGVARLAASYALGLGANSLDVSNELAHGLSRTTGDLFALMFESVQFSSLPDETAVRAATRRRGESYIETHSADPNLDPDSIAAALGISVRYLHRCFESAPLSVMEFLQLQRLGRCHGDLMNPGCNGLQISEIALRNGFRNVCHFNEAFKARYGVSPRQVRTSQSAHPLARQ